jgi:predicted thioredoxin/glutaredoxin
MIAPEMPSIQVFSRRGCHLCEILVDEMLLLVRGQLQVEICDIDTNKDWAERFALRIPVVVFDGHEICQFKLDKDAIARIVDGNRAR